MFLAQEGALERRECHEGEHGELGDHASPCIDLPNIQPLAAAALTQPPQKQAPRA